MNCGTVFVATKTRQREACDVTRARALIVYAYRWDYRGKTRRKTAHCRASTVLAREYTRYPPTLLSSVVCCAVSSTLHHLNDLSRGPRNRERSRATRASSGRSVVKREIYVTQVQKGSLSLTGKSGLTRCKWKIAIGQILKT